MVTYHDPFSSSEPADPYGVRRPTAVAEGDTEIWIGPDFYWWLWDRLSQGKAEHYDWYRGLWKRDEEGNLLR